MNLRHLLVITSIVFSSNSLAQFKNFKLKPQTGPSINSTPSLNLNLEAKLINSLKKIYQNEGQITAENKIRQNDQFTLGSKNQDGLSWSRLFGPLAIAVKRELFPDIFSDKWVVRDTMYIIVDAEEFLGKLSKENIIEISSESFKHFIGMRFLRTYVSTHMANSFQEGLSTEFESLFLSFTKFKNGKYLHLKESETLRKTDSIAFEAGFGASIPIMSNLMLKAEYLAKFDKLTDLYLKRTSDQNLSIQSKHEEYQSSEFKASLTADFFLLMNMSLASVSVEIGSSKSELHHLTLNSDDAQEIEKSPELQEQLDKFVAGKDLENDLKPYLTAHFVEKSEYDRKQAQGLLWNILKVRLKKLSFDKYMNSQIATASLNSKTKFFVKSPLNFLWDSLSKSDPFEFLRESDIKYHERNLAYSNEYLINSESPNDPFQDPVSLPNIELVENIYFNKTLGHTGKKNHAATLEFLVEKTSLSEQLIGATANNQLVGPLSVNATLSLKPESIHNFETLNLDDLKSILDQYCENVNLMLKDISNRQCKKGFEQAIVEKTAGNIYESMYLVLKGMEAKGYDHRTLKEILGDQNLKLSGQMNATSPEGYSFRRYY